MLNKYAYYPTWRYDCGDSTRSDRASVVFGGFGVVADDEGWTSSMWSYAPADEIYLEEGYCDHTWYGPPTVMLAGYLALPVAILHKENIVNKPVIIDVVIPYKANQKKRYIKELHKRVSGRYCTYTEVEENREEDFTLPSDRVCLSAGVYIFDKPWSPDEIFEVNTPFIKKFRLGTRCLSNGRRTVFRFTLDENDLADINTPFEIVLVLYFTSDKYQQFYSFSSSCYYNTVMIFGVYVYQRWYLRFYQLPSANMLLSMSIGDETIDVEFNKPISFGDGFEEGAPEFGTCGMLQYVYTCTTSGCWCHGYRSHSITFNFNYVYQGSLYGPSLLSRYLVEGNRALFIG